MNSLCKTAKILDTVVKLFRVLVFIACVASVIVAALIGGALLFDLESDILSFEDSILTFGNLKLTLSPNASLPVETLLYHALVDVAMTVVMSVFGLIAIRFIRSILHPMTEGEPFRDIVATNLKKLAWVTIIYGAVRFFLDGLESHLMNTLYADIMTDMVSTGIVSDVTYETQSDLTFLLAAGVLFLLSYVFRYAQELQKLSDETL